MAADVVAWLESAVAVDGVAFEVEVVGVAPSGEVDAADAAACLGDAEGAAEGADLADDELVGGEGAAYA